MRDGLMFQGPEAAPVRVTLRGGRHGTACLVGHESPP